MIKMLKKVFGKNTIEKEAEETDRAAKQLILQKALLPEGIFPVQFSINLGAAPCIHSCLFCPQSVKKPEKQWIDPTILEKVLYEMPEEGIMLNVSSYSETMSAPNVFSSLEIMKRIRPKLPIVLASSGVSITEEQVHKLIDVGLDYFQFSFDAADRESYAILMQSDHYDKAVEKLKMVVRIRNERNSSMKINTHIMAFENQVNKFEEFKKEWEDKVDNIQFRPVGNWGDETIELRSTLEANGFKGIYQEPEKRYPCTSIFMHFKLAVDGCYYPCVAYIPGNEDDHKDYMVGDAREVTFKEAWDKLEWHRKNHLDGKWNNCFHCQGCDIWGLWDNMFYEDKNGKFSVDEEVAKTTRW